MSRSSLCGILYFFFFFNDTATTEIYTLSLHDALPICIRVFAAWKSRWAKSRRCRRRRSEEHTSELQSRGLISYAVFCLKKKTQPCGGPRREYTVPPAWSLDVSSVH